MSVGLQIGSKVKCNYRYIIKAGAARYCGRVRFAANHRLQQPEYKLTVQAEGKMVSKWLVHRTPVREVPGSDPPPS